VVQNRTEKYRARKIQEALECNYTRALRIYRSEASSYEIDWDAITNHELKDLFGDWK